ncbi:protein-L-isoaspartate(D-aspartate) O-methyltransferase [Conexibacter sp. JD483]|uniref:protein-L-isoaspartate(D-aspartate) O-methyltransferase n=1 Tax=unclassified Conexibacter TaxID=2627773 RepID=UPI0027241E27|nr:MULTISPECIES: protein-L-isoaspartate(D-aspartate) O-methyltransferase [unclassified Conexibacter]MDO8186312.1 protein-L-isoaspartate(D-aspartate) O-methyltransferase [Conexibacter sp. CPCC 205706]MDO8197517.1 protein-L-isoaspartate(D-aspartate) O-methyltransferase [Conexibacter sp. CPCC 205762]MDR9369661.1 protein-L-isoaspartate(D-aspartate) O-methyltransferase [Conexibacter sp. JD483]
MDPATRLARSLRPLVADRRVLDAIASVPRELFVPPAVREQAYDDCALPIGRGQTISQPLIVARMLALLELQPDDRVLDVGTGSGWHAALLSRLVAHVWTIERHPGLSRWAAANLAAAGIGGDAVTVLEGDGSRGLPQQAPFDAINVAAAAWPDLPQPLVDQLAAGGRLVAPVGGEGQRLVLLERSGDGAELRRTQLEQVRFVPLVAGEAGG